MTQTIQAPDQIPKTVQVATTAVSDRLWTVSDLERMPEGARYELLDGVLYVTAMPLWPHGPIVDNLHAILRQWVHAHRLGRVLTAQSGVYLTELNYVDPDIIYLKRSQMPRRGETRITAATLVVEVLSPSNLRAPREDREERFRRVGVEEIWYVDHATRTLEIVRQTPEGYRQVALLRDTETVTTGVLPGLEFSLVAAWEDLGEAEETEG